MAKYNIPAHVFDGHERYRYGVFVCDRGTMLVRHDGYRLYMIAIESTAKELEEDWVHWAEYKQCNYPGVWKALADVLMNALEPLDPTDYLPVFLEPAPEPEVVDASFTITYKGFVTPCPDCGTCFQSDKRDPDLTEYDPFAECDTCHDTGRVPVGAWVARIGRDSLATQGGQ